MCWTCSGLTKKHATEKFCRYIPSRRKKRTKTSTVSLECEGRHWWSCSCVDGVLNSQSWLVTCCSLLGIVWMNESAQNRRESLSSDEWPTSFRSSVEWYTSAMTASNWQLLARWSCCCARLLAICWSRYDAPRLNLLWIVASVGNAILMRVFLRFGFNVSRKRHANFSECAGYKHLHSCKRFTWRQFHGFDAGK